MDKFEDRFDSALWKFTLFLVGVLIVVNLGRYILERIGLSVEIW